MSEKKSSQSLSISGGQLSDVQIGGMAGNDINLTQNQQISTRESSNPPTQSDVVELIAELEELFRGSDLPPAQTVKAIKHLEAAKEEVKEKEPDKDFAAKNLQRATKVLKEASETIDAGNNLWQKVKSILEIVSPWLGVTSSFLI